MRLIDANALLDEIRKSKDGHHHTEYEILANHHMEHDVFMDLVDCAPTVDAVEVVHGRWEKAHIAGYLKCNCCKDAFIYEEWLESGKWSYCPNCGADMR